MSTDRDVTRIVRSWLEEGVTALPDRVLDTVLDQLPATPQRRAWWPARRFGEMNTYAKVLIAAAAVVVLVAAIGVTVMPGLGGVGQSSGTPIPTATPTPVLTPTEASPTPTTTSSPTPTGATPTASSAEVVRDWPGTRPDENPAGRYSWDPDGGGQWQAPGSAWMHKVPAGTLFIVSVFDNAFRPGPIALTVAGHEATYQTLSPTAKGAVTHVWLVDIDGRKLTITLETQANTTSAALAEAKAVVDSIRVEPTTGTSGFRLTFDLLAGWDSG